MRTKFIDKTVSHSPASTNPGQGWIFASKASRANSLAITRRTLGLVVGIRWIIYILAIRPVERHGTDGSARLEADVCTCRQPARPGSPARRQLGGRRGSSCRIRRSRCAARSRFVDAVAPHVPSPAAGRPTCDTTCRRGRAPRTARRSPASRRWPRMKGSSWPPYALRPPSSGVPSARNLSGPKRLSADGSCRHGGEL